MISETMRRARVLAVMLEDRGGGGGEQPLGRHQLFAPPWKERLLDGSLGASYGPQNYAHACALFEQSRGGGGLWDDSLAGGRGRSSPAPAQHEDAAGFVPLREHLRRIGHTLPERELAALTAIVADGRSVRAAAARAGMSEEKVREAHGRLVAEWRERCARRAA